MRSRMLFSAAGDPLNPPRLDGSQSIREAISDNVQAGSSRKVASAIIEPGDDSVGVFIHVCVDVTAEAARNLTQTFQTACSRYSLVVNESDKIGIETNLFDEFVDHVNAIRQAGTAGLKNADDFANRSARRFAGPANPIADRDHARRLLDEVLNRPLAEHFSYFNDVLFEVRQGHFRRILLRESEQTASQRVPHGRPRRTILAPQLALPDLFGRLPAL